MNDRLPSYDTLRSMYLGDGLSYREIAEKLGIDHYTTVYVALRRGSIRRGHTWPLVRARPRQLNDNTVRADLVVMEIKEYCANSGLSLKQFAINAGVSPSWLWNLTGPNPRRTRIKKSTANRIMKYIVAAEQKMAA